jgi:hypothetical protein
MKYVLDSSVAFKWVVPESEFRGNPWHRRDRTRIVQAGGRDEVDRGHPLAEHRAGRLELTRHGLPRVLRLPIAE